MQEKPHRRSGRVDRELPVDTPQAVRLLRDVVHGLQAVYLFGSHATGQVHPGSDLDLAVLASIPMDDVERYDLAQTLAPHLDCNVDLIDLRAATTVLRMQVIAHGRCLYRGDAAAVEAFEDFVFSDYARLNEERAGIVEEIARRGAVHGG